jgi:tripartite-type tricarboxylate transporter receptor subunit TctC
MRARFREILMRKLACFFSLLLACTLAAAQDYPSKPVQMIVPFPAGGPADIVARLYSQHLAADLGQGVVVLNRDGAGGSIGTAAAARSAPDGYTLVFGTTSTMVVNPLVMKNVPYDFWKDFALIGLIANAPHLLAVREGLPAKSAAELVALAKQSPGKYTIASSGPGTIVQMAAELLRHATGADLLVVPFKGGQPATMALLSGDVDMIVNDLTALKGHLASGKLRALAIAHSARLKPLPDVPTFAELGIPGVVSSTWWGIGAPVKTPAPIRARLRAANAKIINDADYVGKLAGMAVEPLAMTPEQTSAFVAAETQKWKTVATAAKIQID